MARLDMVWVTFFLKLIYYQLHNGESTKFLQYLKIFLRDFLRRNPGEQEMMLKFVLVSCKMWKNCHLFLCPNSLIIY